MLNKRLASFKYAFRGITDLFASTPNARIHLAATFFVVAAGIYFQIERSEWISLVIVIAMVIAAESFNTSIEYLTDLVTKDYHELAKKTKDAAAGGVLICAITALTIGTYIFIPYILHNIFG